MNILLIPLAFAGLFLLVVGAYIVYSDYSASTSWDTATAHVTGSFLSPETHTDRDGHKSTTYRPEINYSYSYGERSYSGHCCMVATSNRAEMQAIVDRNSVGAASNILVNPQNPSESKLKETVQPINLYGVLACIIGVVLLAVGIFGKARPVEDGMM